MTVSEDDIDEMNDSYDFSTSMPNPYSARLRKDITLRMDFDVLEYFERQSSILGIPLESLLNLYLRDCATQERKPMFTWS